LNQRVHVAQARQESGFLQRLLPYRGYIHVLHRRECRLLGRVKLRQLVEPFVGHTRHANVRFARVGIAAIFKLGFRQNLEQRCLAHLRQANNASFHALPMRPTAQ